MKHRSSSITHRLRPRNLWRSILGYLPEARRDDIARSMIQLPPLQASSRLTFKLAQTRSELEGAFRVLHDAYVQNGFAQPHPSGLRVTPYHGLPSTSTLICLDGETVVGTVSIVRDGALGLPMEKVIDITAHRSSERRIAEISSLAIHRNYRESHGSVLWPLLKYLVSYCVDYFGIDTMLIVVNPAHFSYYRAIWNFAELPGSRINSYGFANGAPAVAGAMDLRSLYRFLAIHYGRRDPARNLFTYQFETPVASFVFPERRAGEISDPVMTPELLKYFFVERTQLLSTLAPEDRERLASAYSHAPAYQAVLPLPSLSVTKGTSLLKREERFDVRLRGRLDLAQQSPVEASVHDVSISGLKAGLSATVPDGTPGTLWLALDEFSVAELQVITRWSREDRTYGLEVVKSDRVFLDYLAYLDRRSRADGQGILNGQPAAAYRNAG